MTRMTKRRWDERLAKATADRLLGRITEEEHKKILEDYDKWKRYPYG